MYSHVRCKSELENALSEVAAFVFGAWPDVDDVVVFRRVPSRESYLVIARGDAPAFGTRRMPNIDVENQILEALLQQICGVPSESEQMERGWGNVARLSRNEIERLMSVVQ